MNKIILILLCVSTLSCKTRESKILDLEILSKKAEYYSIKANLKVDSGFKCTDTLCIGKYIRETNLYLDSAQSCLDEYIILKNELFK